MKYNGCMLGDWLLDGDTPRRVIQVTDYAFEGCGAGVILENGMDYVKCKPIPLTSEILEKNGFDVSDGEVMRYNYELNGRKESFVLRQFYDKNTNVPNGFAFFVCDVLTMFDYVHQLQHALRLVGLKELADNFKV